MTLLDTTGTTGTTPGTSKGQQIRQTPNIIDHIIHNSAEERKNPSGEKELFAQIHIRKERKRNPRMLRFFRYLSEYRSELLRRNGFGHSGTPSSPPSRRRGCILFPSFQAAAASWTTVSLSGIARSSAAPDFLAPPLCGFFFPHRSILSPSSAPRLYLRRRRHSRDPHSA